MVGRILSRFVLDEMANNSSANNGNQGGIYKESKGPQGNICKGNKNRPNS